MINIKELRNILETIIVEKPKNFVFHMLCDIKNGQFLTFQANYNNNFYISFILNVQDLVYFDYIEFQPIIMNYEQCIKLIHLCNMFGDNTSVGFDLKESEIEIVVSHSNIKLIFIIDTTIDHDPIVPPEHNLDIPYIPLETKTLSNVVKLVSSPQFYTPIKIDPKNNRIIFGDIIQSIIQLRDEINLTESVIDINPDSIILFLKNVINLNIELVEIKVDTSIAFIIHCQFDLGEVYYYSTHEIE